MAKESWATGYDVGGKEIAGYDAGRKEIAGYDDGAATMNYICMVG